MAKRKSRRRRKRSRKVLWLIAGIMTAITFGMVAYMLILVKQGSTLTKPDELLLTYMDYIRRLRNATIRINTAFFCYKKQITPHQIWYNRVARN